MPKYLRPSPLALLTLVAALSCDDPTAPRLSKAGINFALSRAFSDSAGGPHIKFRIGLADENLAPIANAALTYQIVGPGIFYVAEAPNVLDFKSSGTTGPDGRITLWGSFSCGLGSGWFKVTADVDGEIAVDSVPFAALAGKPDSVQMPVDTAVYQGNTVTMRAVAADKCHHLLPDPVVLQPATGGITIAGNVVTAVATPSRQKIRAVVGSFTDSTWLSIVPTGEISVLLDNLSPIREATGAVYGRLSLDGSSFVPIMTAAQLNAVGGGAGYAAEWLPGGDAVVFKAAGRVLRKSLAGVLDTVVPPLAGGAEYNCPVPSADGQFLYSHRTPPGGGAAMIRSGINPPSASDTVPGQSAGAIDLCPGPSPDGRYLAFSTNRTPSATGACFDGQFSLKILDLTTGTVTSVNRGSYAAPRWSPDGEWIATAHCGELYRVRPNGGSYLPLGTGFTSWLSWSPDSKWIVAERNGPTISIFNRETGERLPLGFTPWMRMPSWRK